MFSPPSQQNNQDTLSRPRVNSLLHAALAHPLVTVTAGSGYGKSLTLRSYLDENNISYVWLQLTHLDNYGTRFWEIYTHALRTKAPELSLQMANMGFPDTLEKTYQFLQGLTKSIYHKNQHCMLVLDDFHKIEDEGILGFVENIAQARLEHFTIALISRYPMPLNYSSLFDNGLLASISVSDLRFTPEETGAYFRQIGLDFPDEVLHNIQTSTEGWPLALYLIGLHRRAGGHLFDDPIECTIPLLYSLIEVEVFSHYPEEIKRCFIKLSLMDSIPLPLAQLLCGPHYTTLSEAMEKNHFCYYNPQAGTYHLHRLFRRFLQAKQGVFSPAQLRSIYQSAGVWYAGQGKDIEAISAFRLCEDYDGIWSVIRTYGSKGYSYEIARLCLECIDRFPSEYTDSHPLIKVFRAHLILNLGDIQRAHQSFLSITAELESLPITPQRSSILGEAYIGLAHTSLFRGEMCFTEYYQKADACLPEGSVILSASHQYVGNRNALMLFSPQAGSMDEMVRLLMQTRPAASRAMNGCGYGAEYLAAAEAEFFRYNLGAATQQCFHALYRAQEKAQHDIVCACYYLLLRIHFAAGDYTKCTQYLTQLGEYSAGVQGQYLHGMDDIATGWFHLNIGQLEKIPRWMLAGELDPKTQAPVTLGREKVIAASYLLRKGQYTELKLLLQKMEGFFTGINAFFLLLQTHILRAVCLQLTGDEAGACKSFDVAYHMAYGNRLILHFIEYGAHTRDLIQLALTHNPTGYDNAFLQDVCAKAITYGKKRAYIAAEYDSQHNLTGARPSLSQQEQAILTQLCLGSTREEIARAQGTSVNTVKSQLKKIFTKLGALNRADAVRIAVESGLVTGTGTP